ncbi:MAG: ATP-binding region [Methanosaeta sp. PtaU1.Bin112]|nr:MAG: ATP-binding region [Methanosaeta sp. PtaU1.Bin112]
MQSHDNAQKNAIVSWTGGKDGCYSCYRAMNDGYNITHILHFTNLKKTGSHELNPALIRAQAQSIGLPLIQRNFQSYEEEFKKAALELRAQGERFDAAVFGHIETHKPLVERICKELDIDLILPLWKENSEKIISEIIDAGFETILVSVRDGFLGKEWLGRKIDGRFLADLKTAGTAVDACGENGEFHTLVLDGPIFKKRIVITGSNPIHKEGYWFLNITDFNLQDK